MKDDKKQKNSKNKFDNSLKRGVGDIKVIMRISDDSYLLERILGCMHELAFNVKMSLHQNNFWLIQHNFTFNIWI